jgi:carbon monoxide dehydrogenase subunit G
VKLDGERTFSAPRDVVWHVLNDPHAMAKTMPGVESIDVHDSRRWTAKVKIPLGLGALRMKVDMETVEARAPEFARMAVKGSGVGAALTMETSFTLGDAPDGATVMAWTADVTLGGPVGSMGQQVLEPIVGRQVEHVLAALDREVQEAMRASAA